jgi:hypothetical protein
MTYKAVPLAIWAPFVCLVLSQDGKGSWRHVRNRPCGARRLSSVRQSQGLVLMSILIFFVDYMALQFFKRE